MNRVKWAFLWIGLGLIWIFKIMNLLPGDWFGNFYRLKYLFPGLLILLGLYLFLRNRFPRFASWILWLILFLMGLWLLSTTYNEKTWI